MCLPGSQKFRDLCLNSFDENTNLQECWGKTQVLKQRSSNYNDLFSFCSGKELLDLKNNKARPRNLPSMPPKEFVPTGSAEEAASIEKMVQEQMSFLKDERVEKKYLLL